MLKSYFDKNRIEAGCDEVGRGCLAGPVVAAAVILPKNYIHDDLNDSKLLTEKQRVLIKKELIEEALCWGIGVASPEEIDEINILNASFLAMHRAIKKLVVTPELLLIDGNRFTPFNDISYECFINGDGRYLPIAAASVLAKNYRDDLMRNLATEFPGYGWETNVGYSTKIHREGIRKCGITLHHRKSFRLLPR